MSRTAATGTQALAGTGCVGRDGHARAACRAAVVRAHALIRGVLPILPLAFCLLGVIVRVTVQDRVPTWASVYYATPPPVLASLALLAGVLWLVQRRRKAALSAFALGLTCLVWTWGALWVTNPPPPAGASHGWRVLFWNVARGSHGWERVADALRTRDADIIGLVETTADVPAVESFWESQLPGYEHAVFSSGISLLVKGSIAHQRGGTLAGRGWFEHSLVQIGSEAVHVVVVDLKSNPFRTRARALARLQEVLAPLDGQPVILMGDFNAPTDSVLFEPLRRDFRHAFETAGTGYAPTWPLPVPVLTIDQVWANAGIEIRNCDLQSTWGSDHRIVGAEIALRP